MKVKALMMCLAVAIGGTSQAAEDKVEVSLSTQSKSVSGPFMITVHKKQKGAVLEDTDVSVYNGRVSLIKDGETSSQVWIEPASEGEVAIFVGTPILTQKQQHRARKGKVKFADSEYLTVTYAENDLPSVSLFGALTQENKEFDIAINFSEAVSGLSLSDFQLFNAVATNLEGEGRYYHLTVSANEPGEVTALLPTGAVRDLDGDKMSNSTSNLFKTQAQFIPGQQIVIQSGQEWQQNLKRSSDVKVIDGELHPVKSRSLIQSKFIKTDPNQTSVSFTLSQSPVWNNWQPIDNVKPKGARNALVFVPVSDGNYYILGAKSRTHYDAWHSTDMKTWTHKGPVTPEGAYWVTTAEYKDGLFYIYYDDPNDEDPALIIDDDLSDGVPGHRVGTVFKDPSHGSDISIFRDDADDRFHMIYEEWSPLHAQSHAWDSPLAGHTSSWNGMHGFEAHEHQPPIDLRTKDTGEYDVYQHGWPRRNKIYKKHQGEQQAFGDWTTIKIGGQYYLFSDYHSGKGKPMQTARFTSDSIHKEFKLVGALGEGHPDPSVGFAEGKFYLITQRTQDFVSPGPWVEGVKARVGVDINGDNRVDRWTDWQELKETYRQKDGYLRVVEKTPASIDLSNLPSGKQVMFEIQVDDEKTKGVTPLISKAELQFGS